MSEPIIVKAGDYGYSFSVGVTQNGYEKSLAGYSAVALHIWDEFSPDAILWTLSGEVMDAESDMLSFTLADGDCTTPGVYCCEVEMTGEGARESSDTYRMLVKESA